MPLRVPGRGAAQQQQSHVVNVNAATTPSSNALSLWVVVDQEMRRLFEALGPRDQPLLLAMHSVVFSILNGGSMDTYCAQHVNLPPDLASANPTLRAIVFVERMMEASCRAFLNDLNDRCIVPRKRAPYPQWILSTLKQFGDFERSVRFLEKTFFSAYDKEVQMHCEHKVGQCDCARFDSFQTLGTCRRTAMKVWREVAFQAHERDWDVAVRRAMTLEWSDDLGDATILSQCAFMCSQTSTEEWLSRHAADSCSEACRRHLARLFTTSEAQLSIQSAASLVNLFVSRSSRWLSELSRRRVFQTITETLILPLAARLVVPNVALWYESDSSNCLASAYTLHSITRDSVSLGVIVGQQRVVCSRLGIAVAWFEESLTAALVASLQRQLFGENNGAAASNTTLEGATFQRALLAWHHRTLTLLSKACNADSRIATWISNAVATVVLASSSQCSWLLCSAVNSSIVSNDSDEIGETLTLFDLVFPHLRDKDVVAETLSTQAENRFLHGVRNVDVEMALARRIDQGTQGRAIRNMIADLQSSQEHMTLAKQKQPVLLTDFTAEVLSQNSWRLSYEPLSSCRVLVPSMNRQLKAFTELYQHVHGHRQLKWCTSRCSVMLRTTSSTFHGGSGAKKAYTLKMWFNTAMALLLFNGQPTVSASDILQLHQNTTAQRDGELDIQSANRLAAQVMQAPKKLGLVNVTSSSSDPARSMMVFSLNTQFNHRRLDINLIPKPTSASGGLTSQQQNAASSQSSQQSDKEADQMKKLRKVQLEACIVKVMKSAKLLHHADLIHQAVNGVRKLFVPDVPLIKNCIEDLIEKDYLIRADGDRNVYLYKA